MHAKRTSLSESPWFWVHLFAVGALVALMLINKKADEVQAQRDGNFTRRQQSLEQHANESPIVENSTDVSNLEPDEEEQLISFTPFYALFGIIAIVAWILLWRERWGKPAAAS